MFILRPNMLNAQYINSHKRKETSQAKSKSKVRIDGNIENRSCCTKWVEPKTVFEPTLNRQNSQGQN